MAIHLLRFMVATFLCMGATGCEDNYFPGGDTHNERIPHPAESSKTVELTLVTYNVANMGHGGDQTDNIVEFIKGTGADLVGLNELDSCNSRHNVYQLKVLAEKLGGWDYHFGNALNFGGGSYGNGALSKLPIMSATTVSIPKGNGHEPRSIALIETEDIVFGAVHLDFGPPGEPSYPQAQYINDWFSEHYTGCGKPVILCGDFNTDPGTDTQNEMEKCWTRLSEPELSWPTGKADMCLDYVFCFKGAVQAEAVETARPTGIIDLDATSDHYPVRVKIRFRKNPSTAKPDRGVEKGSVKVNSVSLYGPAAGNAMAMGPVYDTKGLVKENSFEAYLPPSGGKLVICDDMGVRWLLKPDGRLVPGEGYNSFPGSDGEATLLSLDFDKLSWEAIGIQKVELQPAAGNAEPVPMIYQGGGKWRTESYFTLTDGFQKFLYRVYSDNSEKLYAWIRCADGTVGRVGEAELTESMAFNALSSLSGARVSAGINLRDRTQQIAKDTRSFNAVLIGDSITEVWGKGESNFFNTNKYLNKGISGQTSATIRSRFKNDVVTVRPYVVHIMCGTNDVAENDGRYVASREIADNIIEMATMAREAGIKVIIGSVFPCNYFSWRGASWTPSKEGMTIVSHIQEVNSLLKEYCQANGITFIDYYSAFVNPSDGSFPLSYDGCHPGSDALKTMNNMAKAAIDAQLE